MVEGAMATLDLEFTPRALHGDPPPLGARMAHVWRIDLGVAPHAEILSQDEHARAQRKQHAGARSAFVRTRTALRRLLGYYTGHAPADLPIATDANGKPFLALPHAPQFNVTHSGDLALIALTAATPVGIDVEPMRKLAYLERIAQTHFSRAECAALMSLPEAERPDAFHACWTRKEAYVKATGDGIANGLALFEVSLLPGEPARLIAIGEDTAQARDVTLHAFRAAPDTWAAVCVLAAGFELQGFAGLASEHASG